MEWQVLVGTQGELSTLSDSTVEGGPGLEDVLSNNDKLGNDSRLVYNGQFLLLVLPDGVLVVLVGHGGGLGDVQLSTVHVNLLSFVPTW